MASGWNLWAWLQCIGVASRCCCKEVYTVDILIIIINFSYILHLYILGLLLAAASLLLCSFLIFRSCFRYFFTIYSKRYSYIEHSRSFKKIEIPRI